MILRFGFLCVLIVTAGAAFAHHSAPVFYKVDERITVSGTVTEFRFNNPHAILKFDVVAANGGKQQWTAETTSPSISRHPGARRPYTPPHSVALSAPSNDAPHLHVALTRTFTPLTRPKRHVAE